MSFGKAAPLSYQASANLSRFSMRVTRFEAMPNAGSQIVESLFDAIDRLPDMAEMFESDIFSVFGHWQRSV